MVTPWRRLVLLLLLLCGAVPGFAGLAQAGTPRIWRVCVTDVVVPPYLHNDAAHPGIIERLIQGAAQQQGLHVMFLRYPVRRCMALMESGGVDASLAGSTDVNLKRYQFPMKDDSVDTARRLARLNFVWVHRAESKLEWDGKTLTGMRPERTLVGARSGIQAAIDPLRAQGFQVDDASTSTRQLLMKLVLKRVDLAVTLQESIEAALPDPALNSLVVMPRAFLTRDFYLVHRRGAPRETQEIFEAWWNAIGRLREQREYGATKAP